jgi:hypothetical protein
MGGTEDEVAQLAHVHGRGPGVQVSNPFNSGPTGAIPSSDRDSTWGDVIALSDRVYEVDQGWSSDEDEPPIHRQQHRRGSTNEHRGRHLAVMGQDNKIEVHTISPIPFDIQKQPRLQTPSISSDNTEQESYSPLFPYSCKAAVKEAYKKFAFTSTEGPMTGGLNSAGVRPKNIEEWLNQTQTSEQATSIEIAESFEIWEDVESGGQSTRKSTTLPCSALQDVTNFRPLKAPHFEGVVRNPAVAMESRSNIDATRVAALKGAKKLPSRNPSGQTDAADLPETVHVQNPIDAVQFECTHVALQGNFIPHAPCPLMWLTSLDASSGGRLPQHGTRVAHYELALMEGETNSSSSPSAASVAIENAAGEQDSARAAHFAFALARLEGRVSPKASSPIQRFVNTAGMHGDDDPLLRQPTPLRWISHGGLFERFHVAAATGLLYESNHSTNSSLETDQNCMERPENPTPSRGRNGADWIEDRAT